MNNASSDFVLIVDDNPDNLSVLAQTLRAANYPVRVAIDGESALVQIAEEPPALILLDVMMPGIDGFETCRRLKAMPETASIPVIFMTALSDEDDKVTGLSMGAVDYVTKPLKEDEVLARVRLQMKVRHLMRSLKDKNQQLLQEVKQKERAEQSLKALNETLENSVAERTAQLQQAMTDLKNAQISIVKHEKLSALGDMVAGIAHEINNPIGCIISNLEFAQTYSEQLMAHIALYQALLAKGATPEERDRAIAAHADAIELDYIIQDFPELLRAMNTSGDRIFEISRSLRTFARQDAGEKHRFDLHEGLEGTLLILKHRLKAQEDRADVEIVRRYGDLPKVHCFSGQISQVLMNILANAVDAIDEQRPPSPQITLSTQQQGQWLQVEITDNAGGITEAVQARIFERNFTTKAVGKGTGLGLSIAHQIITDTHGGELLCKSAMGTGTTFTLRLPVEELSPEDKAD